MPRATWSGQISFGLVSVPVKLFTASRSHDVSFREINEATGARVRRQRIDGQTGEEVPLEAIKKGFEVDGGYVLVDPEEIERLKPRGGRTVEIESFVELPEIEPIYFERPYYLLPDGEPAKKPYHLLVEAMDRTGKAAIGRFVMRTKEYLAAIRPRDGVLLLSTMRYADEVVEPRELDIGLEQVEVTDRELDMAEQLIGSLTTGFDPTDYEDTYQQQLRELLQAKAEGQEPTVEAVEEETGAEVVDLVKALEQSLKGRRAKSEKTDGYDDMSKTALYDLAQKRDIEGRSRMSKGELIEALRASDQVAAAS
jgi:DNA end-binding protein Ku